MSLGMNSRSTQVAAEQYHRACLRLGSCPREGSLESGANDCVLRGTRERDVTSVHVTQETLSHLHAVSDREPSGVAKRRGLD